MYRRKSREFGHAHEREIDHEARLRNGRALGYAISVGRTLALAIIARQMLGARF